MVRALRAASQCRYIDSHVHLEQFDLEDSEALVARARTAGVRAVVAVGTTVDSYRTLLEWKQRHPDFVNVALGLHPEIHHSSADLRAIMKQVRTLSDRLVAIGEIGLPYYSDPSGASTKASRCVAAEFVNLALEVRLPLLVHAVHNAAPRMLEILQEGGAVDAVFHWLKAPSPVVKSIVDSGYHVSVSPSLAHKERDRHLALQVPTGLLLVETDAPADHRPSLQSTSSEPWQVSRAVAAISAVRGVPHEVIARQVWTATRNVLRRLRVEPAVLTCAGGGVSRAAGCGRASPPGQGEGSVDDRP